MSSPVLKSALSLLAAVALCGTACAAPLNLLTNGSFEQGTLGIGSFAGWQTTLGDISTFVDSSGQTGRNYGQATDGLWSAFFGSSAADGGASIAQSFLTTAGQSYSLQFDLANDNGGFAASNSFVVSLGGVSVFTATNLGSQNYQHQQVSFVGTGASTTLQIAAFNDQSFFDLDNVSVAAVTPVAATPEPSSLVLLATGLAGALGAAKRRMMTK